MAERQRRDIGDGCISQRKDGTWTSRIKIGLTPEGKPKSYDRLEQTINNQIIPHIGHLQLAALTSDDVQKMINDLKAEGLGYSTIKKAYDAINECFKTGIIKKSVVHNPALGVTTPAKKSFPKFELQC